MVVKDTNQEAEKYKTPWSQQKALSGACRVNTGMKSCSHRYGKEAGTGSAMNSAHPALFPSANLGLERGKSSIVRWCFVFGFFCFFSEHHHLPSPPKKPTWGHFSHCSPKLHESSKIISFWAHPTPPPGWWCWEGVQHSAAPNLCSVHGKKNIYRLL